MSVWLMLLSGPAVAAPEEVPLAAAKPPSRLSYALLGVVPTMGSSHREGAVGQWLRFTPGIGARFELGWGDPDLRGAMVASLVDTLTAVPEGYRSDIPTLGLGLQANVALRESGDWQLRLPLEAGLFAAPFFGGIRVGAGLRLQRLAVPVRPVVSVLAVGELGTAGAANCQVCAGDGLTGSGWQVALLAGAEIGGPPGLASPSPPTRRE